jgi:enediyne biosynthesis protein E4
MAFKLTIPLYISISVLVLISACNREKEDPLFILLNPEETGITFINTITPDDILNIQDFPFLYNGGGVAVGDINNNGLPDIYFTGNMVSSRLYLNKGNMEFVDITESAGVSTDRWASGASMVDINGNGYLDIYVSVAGPGHIPAEKRANLLFINNGDGTFTESAKEYNLADTSFTTHAAFLDYNGNGYLDVFLLNNSPDDFARGATSLQTNFMGTGSNISFDKLYRNNGDGTFTDVSREAGILEELGYGLGVVVADLNRNGLPDIYVSNDIQPNDFLYINNGDGTFTDKSAKWLKHTSYAGMGVDIADFNNDGWPDILQVDMMPPGLNEQKKISGATTYSNFRDLIRQGFQHQYTLNTLQLSNGMNKSGDLVFSEIARQAGVAYTDWSWAALFADFDNDGLKDILITNGYPKAVNDFDYLFDMHAIRHLSDHSERFRILDELHSFHVADFIYRNNGDLTFEYKTVSWGLDHPAYAYGAAYADLNNNGKLDLVINNIDSPASIYLNTGTGEDPGNFLQVRLKGEYPNTQGIGSEIVITSGGQKQHVYQSPYRGYQSTVDDRLHFGLGSTQIADSLEVYWPDGRYQLLTGISSNQLITIDQSEAASFKKKFPAERETNNIFTLINPGSGINWKHQENDYSIDYNVQSLLPYQLSKIGPALATGDVTGNGLDDIYVGGAAGFAGKLFLQQSDGRFTESAHLQPWEPDRNHEDIGALFFDSNGNGLLDLYVASGGYELAPVSNLLQDRLYINHGNGRFLKDETALPQMLTSTSVVKATDFTGNGLPDLFVGGRMEPRNYPYPTRSYILMNQGGRFTDITESVAPDLLNAGMITDALWIDINNNGKTDLVTAGEWSPVTFYMNIEGQLQNITENAVSVPQTGWWYSLAAGDFNNNGYTDIVAGNLGLNHSFTTSPDSPFGVYAADFTENRNTEIIFTKSVDGVEYPYFGLAKLGRAINEISIRYPRFEDFADVSVQQIFGPQRLNNAIRYKADTFASTYYLNNGDGTFSTHELPALAQISPIKSIIVHDVDGDGNEDLIITGNIYQTDPAIARVDAGNGLWLRGDGNGNFIPVSPFESGLLAPGDVKNISLIRNINGLGLVIANNSDSLQVYSINNDYSPSVKREP